MFRLPRKPTPFGPISLRLPALVCAASIVFGGAGRSFGQAETATTAAAAPAPDAAAAPAAESLKDSVDNFWHYGKIARYDVAATEAQHILAQNADPLQLLTVFEAVAAQHHDDLDEWLLRWQGVDQLSAPTTQLITILAQGHNARRNDPKYIEQNIQLLATNQRGYDLSIDRLRESGELAVPMMLDYLRDPSKTQYHGAIRRALRGLGL